MIWSKCHLHRDAVDALCCLCSCLCYVCLCSMFICPDQFKGYRYRLSHAVIVLVINYTTLYTPLALGRRGVTQSSYLPALPTININVTCTLSSILFFFSPYLFIHLSNPFTISYHQKKSKQSPDVYPPHVTSPVLRSSSAAPRPLLNSFLLFLLVSCFSSFFFSSLSSSTLHPLS